ncbi:cell division protein FtsZ [Hyphomicrobium sp.]|uniref:cell division protein FtsZ n=1 Tax=Hyphomicrobium sp. TaxID=82 RepID=UPI003F71BBF6
MGDAGQRFDFSDLKPKLTVIGVGGAGCNAINNMIATGLSGVDFIVANTDAQALATAATEHRLQLGVELTEGLGAGSRPEIGEAAAEEAVDEIRKQIKGSHMVFIAAGMGGGTGTGAASVIARVARELGILTVGVVTKPFLFEGARRMRIAEAGVAELRHVVDTLIVIPNQNLFRIASDKTTFAEAFVMADQVLYSGVACIVDLILKEGLINLDFADVRTVMSGMGTAMMGTGEATGERRATVAAEEAISNPLLDDVSLRGAKGLLLSITGGPDLTLYEVDEAASRVRQEVDPEANIIVGATYDPSLGDRIRVSIVASGMSRAGEAERAPPAPAEDWARVSQNQRPPAPQHSAPPRQPPPRADDYGYDRQRDPRDTRGGAYDLQQRLTEALQQPLPQTASYGAPRPGVPPALPGDPARRMAGEPWRGPGNVRIEDGPPQLQAASAPPPLPQHGYASDYAQGGQFAPQPPTEVRRPARHGEYAQQRGHDQGYGDPQQARQGEAEPRRRIGLFERLTGRVRGSADSPASAPPPAETYPYDGRPNAAPSRDHDAYGQYPQTPPQPTQSSQDAELPVFFRERRK